MRGHSQRGQEDRGSLSLLADRAGSSLPTNDHGIWKKGDLLAGDPLSIPLHRRGPLNRGSIKVPKQMPFPLKDLESRAQVGGRAELGRSPRH